VCSNAVRTQLLTSCVRRHVTKYVTYTKIHPESYYFCVVFGGGRFRSVTDSRKKHHGTIPHLITTQRVGGCVHPRDVTQNKYVQHTCTFFCNPSQELECPPAGRHIGNELWACFVGSLSDIQYMTQINVTRQI